MDKTKIISLLVNVIVIVALFIAFREMSRLRASNEAMESNYRTEMEGVKQTLLDNGTQLTKMGEQTVSRKEFKDMNEETVRWMEQMGLKHLRKVDDIVLMNTRSEYILKDTTVVFTDTSVVQRIERLPWISVDNTIDLNTGVSDMRIEVYDSLIIAGTWSYDKDYWWPKRLWKERDVTLNVNNANPYSRVVYLRKYKLDKK